MSTSEATGQKMPDEQMLAPGPLIKRMMAEASRPVTMKGGAGQRLRAQQNLLRQAAIRLAKWGRPDASRKRQPADLFTPSRAAE